MTSSPFVTAVSGVSGAGKTSLIDRTVALLGDAVALHFDDYASVSTYPTDLRAWMHAGADVDAWKTPRLSEDLARLRAGERAESGATDAGIKSPSCQLSWLELELQRSTQAIEKTCHLLICTS